MIGTLLPQEKKVTILGAGINGLLIGYFLKKKGFEVKILEALDHVGGVIQTLETSAGIIETAAHSLLVSEEMKLFFVELGIELVPVSPNSRARFIYRKGKMRKMPLTLIEILQTIIRFFSRPKVPLNFSTATLAEWGNTYVGKAATQYLLSPFITGIFACRPEELNAKIAFPKLIPTSPLLSLFQFFRAKKKSTRPKMMAPRLGMQILIERLAEELKNEIHLSTTLSTFPTGENYIFSIPTPELSKLIAKEDPVSAQALLQVRYAPLISVTCFYRKSEFPNAPVGVGVLIPRGEGLRALGCLFNSSSFLGRAKSDFVSLTVMYGGTPDPEVLLLSDSDLEQILIRELASLFHTQAKPESLQITRWPRAIPIYSQELKIAREAIQMGFCAVPGRVIFSNYSKEVSIRSSIEALLQL